MSEEISQIPDDGDVEIPPVATDRLLHTSAVSTTEHNVRQARITRCPDVRSKAEKRKKG